MYYISISTYLHLYLRVLDVIKYPEHNLKEVLPPSLLEVVPIRLHYFKHDCQAPAIIQLLYHTHYNILQNTWQLT